MTIFLGLLKVFGLISKLFGLFQDMRLQDIGKTIEHDKEQASVLDDIKTSQVIANSVAAMSDRQLDDGLRQFTH